MTFKKTLRSFRGERLQKEMADLLDVSLKTYQGWEQGRNPSRYSQNLIRSKIQQLQNSNAQPNPPA
jgi:DNA-binding transcriptional regulator YiaG